MFRLPPAKYLYPLLTLLIGAVAATGTILGAFAAMGRFHHTPQAELVIWSEPDSAHTQKWRFGVENWGSGPVSLVRVQWGVTWPGTQDEGVMICDAAPLWSEAHARQLPIRIETGDALLLDVSLPETTECTMEVRDQVRDLGFALSKNLSEVRTVFVWFEFSNGRALSQTVRENY